MEKLNKRILEYYVKKNDVNGYLDYVDRLDRDLLTEEDRKEIIFAGLLLELQRDKDGD